jgi:hypothetical protein
MKYYIPEIDRTAELDDELVKEYCKSDSLRGNTFILQLYMEYGKIPTRDELSDEEFSVMCNEILFDTIKCLALLPSALQTIYGNWEEWNRKAADGELVEIDLNGGDGDGNGNDDIGGFTAGIDGRRNS